MRLTLNLKDDALHPSGHPLVLFCATGTMQTSRSDCILCQHDVTAALPMFVAIDGPCCHGKSTLLVSTQTTEMVIVR